MFFVALLLGFFFCRAQSGMVNSTNRIVHSSVQHRRLSHVDWNNTIIGLASPLLQSVAIFSFVLSYNLVTEQREKRYIRQTFSKFVSKSVVDDLLKHPEKLKLGGERKILTVLFSDIRGFTSISERLTPEQLVEHLNEYLQSMTDIVIKYDGTLDKYVGDEIMASGRPIPQEDHALRACKGALR
jgi:adenylate cyclase